MAKVEKHPTQEGKYRCTKCSYGHEKGKSRQAVYKHYNKMHKTLELEEETILPEESEDDFFEIPGARIPIEEEPVFEEISWLDAEDQVESTPHTIPDPIKNMAGREEGQLLQAHRTMTKSLVRWSFMGLDRLITHWGKGVTNDPNYALQRTRQDYDILQNSTVTMLDAYGLQIPSSPIVVWSTIVGSAYVPPIIDIQAKADPSRRGIFRAILSKIPFIGRRFRKKKKETLVKRDEPIS
tara:strand:+ start:5246 stop:5959 length:714 start_codon:yes stop_codon:yes gene_type:complete